MRQVTFFVLMSLSFLTFSQNSSQPVISEIEALINQYANKNDVPAISVGIVIKEQAYFINHGEKKRLSKDKVNQKSIFQIGSVSKLLTGIIINDLVQKGKIDINEPILTYLPKTYSNKIKSKLKDITIRDLLHHQSGFMHQSKVIKRNDGDPIVYDYRKKDFEKDFEKMKIKSKGIFNYSNFGYAVLG